MRFDGITCPVCGWPETKVVDSRPRATGTIVRRRICNHENCGYKWSTKEVYLEPEDWWPFASEGMMK